MKVTINLPDDDYQLILSDLASNQLVEDYLAEQIRYRITNWIASKLRRELYKTTIKEASSISRTDLIKAVSKVSVK